MRLTKSLVASLGDADKDDIPRKNAVPGLQTGRPLIAFDLLCRVLRGKTEGRNFATGDAARQNTRIVLPRGSVPVSRPFREFALNDGYVDAFLLCRLSLSTTIPKSTSTVVFFHSFQKSRVELCGGSAGAEILIRLGSSTESPTTSASPVSRIGRTSINPARLSGIKRLTAV